MKFLTNGYVSVLSIALIGVAIGLWTRSARSSKSTHDAPPGVLASSLQPEDCDPRDKSIFSVVSNAPIVTSVAASPFASEIDSVDPIRSGTPIKQIEMLPGIAHPLQVAEISAAADGPLWKLFVAEGDVVDSDTVLALIDNRVALASLVAAQSSANREAMLQSANAKVSLAEQFLDRIQQAARKKAASGLEVDEATSRRSEAKAALQEGLESQRDAIARMNIEQARLETFEIRAPFKGTVIKIHPHLGETVSRGAPIIKIADINLLRADLYVPLSLVSAQRIGKTVELRADLPNRPLLNAKIVFITPLIDAATQTVRVVVEIDNTAHQLLAGFAVRLSHTGTDSDYH